MELKEFFSQVGGEYEQVLDRLPSEAMVLRFLNKFTLDPSYGQLKAALEAEDIATAFRAAHTLKGTAATLGLDALAAAASELTEALWGADQMPNAGLVEPVDDAYKAAIELIAGLDS